MTVFHAEIAPSFELKGINFVHMKKNGKSLRIYDSIAASSKAKCEDFAIALLGNDTQHKQLRKEARLNSPEDVDSMFVRSVFSEWLKKGKKDEGTPRTWADLADCVENFLDDSSLAEQIRDFCC